MTDAELQQLVEQIANEFFSAPFEHQARFNGRLKTTGGRYLLVDHNIEINPKILPEQGMVVLIGVIKHELVHYYLHLHGRPFNHRSVDFKQLLHEVGGLRFVPVNKKVPPKKYCYQCGACKQRYYRQRKIDVEKYMCGKCRGKLFLI